jgi:uncharacterized protein
MPMNDQLDGSRLGIVVGGSLTKGVDVKLDAATSIEEIAVGRYVTIQGQKRRFFGMITDVSLESTDPLLSVTPPDTSDPFVAEVLAGTSAYGKLSVSTYLTIGSDASSLLDGPQPVKTVPAHFSAVKAATQQDVERVFGKEDASHFFVGNPLDMQTKVCLDLHEFVKRSNGVFGKSGTGKTFLTRLLLLGMLQTRAAVSLVFDMHSEYGWKGLSEGRHDVKGLKQLFPERTSIFSLDEESAKRRKVKYDFAVKIGYDEIEPEDIGLLSQTLNLTEQSTQAVYQFARRFGQDKWISRLLDDSDAEMTTEELEKLNVHEGTYRNLKRGLERLRRLPFLVPSVPKEDRAVPAILRLLERDTNVILEFGGYEDYTAYMLVANLLTRRIHSAYQEKSEKASGDASRKPRPLMIVIEEAHRFLNPELSGQTIFGTIAREMRKYNVSLLVVDQRPSGIDDEIMSQMGTKLTCLLDDERDVDSVLSGVSGRNELKSVLAKMESKQQALIFGHAVPMPIVVKVREYGSAESYAEFGAGKTSKEASTTDGLWDN